MLADMGGASDLVQSMWRVVGCTGGKLGWRQQLMDLLVEPFLHCYCYYCSNNVLCVNDQSWLNGPTMGGKQHRTRRWEWLLLSIGSNERLDVVVDTAQQMYYLTACMR